LERFKVRLDWGWSNLIQLKMSLLMAVGLDPMDLKRTLPIPTNLQLSDPALNTPGVKAMPGGVELPEPPPPPIPQGWFFSSPSGEALEHP